MQLKPNRIYRDVMGRKVRTYSNFRNHPCTEIMASNGYFYDAVTGVAPGSSVNLHKAQLIGMYYAS